ncbi:MAG: glycosyltransferase family 4 protein [Candidatus Omnitrophica bacterium]|nr:glycosyltransferase family 4 protein [Candidatus Omnitrophota bacterium]
MIKKQICMSAYTNYRSDARVRREAETLAAGGEFDVLCLSLRENEHAKSYKIENVRVLELNVKKYRGQSKFRHFTSYMKFFLLVWLKCNTLLLKRKLDIAHFHNMPNFLVFAGLLARLFGKKVVLDIHDSTPEMYCARYGGRPNGLLSRAIFWEERLSCNLANILICANHVMREQLIARGIPSRKITVSMNAPDPRLFKAGRKLKDAASRNNIKLVYHGTIAKRLGIDLAIRAFAKLQKEYPDMEFYIIGDGEALAECMALSKDLRLENNIHFSEKMLPLESIPPILRDMDIGIVSNRKNSATELMLPVKMLEYIALGIPVVAPKLKAIERYFTDEMVCHFEPEDIDSLGAHISDLCKNENKRKAQVEKAKIFLNKYGWDKYGADFVKLFREM